MKPDTSRWREESVYDFMDSIGADQLAWECLRRNADYQQDYAVLRLARSLYQPVPDRLESRWGLRFRSAARSFSHRSANFLE